YGRGMSATCPLRAEMSHMWPCQEMRKHVVLPLTTIDRPRPPPRCPFFSLGPAVPSPSHWTEQRRRRVTWSRMCARVEIPVVKHKEHCANQSCSLVKWEAQG